MVKKICEKKVGNTVYELKYFKGDNKYVIYKLDENKMMDGKVHRIPEVGVFNDEKDAREYLDKLTDVKLCPECLKRHMPRPTKTEMKLVKRLNLPDRYICKSCGYEELA